MKKNYIAPSTHVVLANPVLMNTDSDGWRDPKDSCGKETTFEEVETGIPDHYTSIWGDEAEED